MARIRRVSHGTDAVIKCSWMLVRYTYCTSQYTFIIFHRHSHLKYTQQKWHMMIVLRFKMCRWTVQWHHPLQIAQPLAWIHPGETVAQTWKNINILCGCSETFSRNPPCLKGKSAFKDILSTNPLKLFRCSRCSFILFMIKDIKMDKIHLSDVPSSLYPLKTCHVPGASWLRPEANGTYGTRRCSIGWIPILSSPKS